MSLLEGMAYGCACVASEVGGIPQVIHHNEDGILITPKDKEKLKDAIRSLLVDHELQEKLGDAGRKKVAEEFELNKSLEQLVKIYYSLQ